MSFTLAQILDWTGGRVANAPASGVDSVRVERPNQLQGSQAKDVAFFFSRDFEAELPSARPGILITGEPFIKPLEKSGLPLWSTSVVVACPDPYRAMGVLTEKFAAELTVSHLPSHRRPEGARGPSFLGKISKLAEVHPSAKLGRDVSIAAGVVVEEGAQIGDRVVLYPGVFVGPNVVIGEDSVIFPQVVLYEQVQIGKRVRIHANSVLGADGFGYAPVKEGSDVKGHQKIYHFGRVVIGDDVEIGALTAIDRGTFGDTVVEKNAKVDNLCQLGHNTRLEEGAVVCGGNSLAGGSSVGKYALVLGICGLANRVHVGAGARVAAMTLVSKDVPPGTTVSGNPMREHKQNLRLHAMLNKMAEKPARKREE
jgi:UDP-3-O-[3-hydroxymyristoyl] glucosamine N-acyltransferase